MNTSIDTHANAAAIASNLSRLRDFLKEAAVRGAEACDLIHSGELNRAIGVVLGLDAVLEDSKALYGAAVALHRAKAGAGGSRMETRPPVIGLLTPEDLEYIHELLGAEEALDPESQHLPGEMPARIRERIVVPQTEALNFDGIEVSAAQMARLDAYWSEIAGEPVRAEALDYAFVALCSELAALRLERKYNNRPKAQAINSQNLGSWVFSLERDIPVRK